MASWSVFHPDVARVVLRVLEVVRFSLGVSRPLCRLGPGGVPRVRCVVLQWRGWWSWLPLSQSRMLCRGLWTHRGVALPRVCHVRPSPMLLVNLRCFLRSGMSPQVCCSPGRPLPLHSPARRTLPLTPWVVEPNACPAASLKSMPGPGALHQSRLRGRGWRLPVTRTVLHVRFPLSRGFSEKKRERPSQSSPCPWGPSAQRTSVSFGF